MTHTGLVTLVFCGMTTTLSLDARAADVEAVGPPPTAAPAKIQVGVMFVPSPIGTLHSDYKAPLTVGSDPAYGFMTTFDFLLRPNAFVGFAPSATFHIKARGSSGEYAGNELDLLLRFGVCAGVGSRFHVYGYLSPGYSFTSGLPPTASQGPLIGLHAGGIFDITPALFLAAELGYQAGFQRGQIDGVDISQSAGLIQTAVGVGARI